MANIEAMFAGNVRIAFFGPAIAFLAVLAFLADVAGFGDSRLAAAVAAILP